MAKLEVNTEKYLEEILNEINMSMLFNPEVTATDKKERKQQAADWVNSRINQIEGYSGVALTLLDKATRLGYLSPLDFTKARDRYEEAFKKLIRETKDKYKEITA